MANPISQVQSAAGPLKYVEYAKTVLTTKGKYPFVLKNGTVVQAEIDKKQAAIVLKEANAVSNNRTKALEFLKNKELVVAKYGIEALSVGRLVKPAGEKIESGYLAEAILQAAIAARLVKRNNNISVSDVVSFLKDFVDSKTVWNTGQKSTAVNRIIEYEADNLGMTKKDLVVNYMSLNDKAYTYLKKNLSGAASNPNLRAFFNDSVNYVNTGQPKEHSDYFYTNKRTDLLNIKSLGILGQTQTKSDIVTSYLEGYNPQSNNSGKMTDFNLNISVKIRGETQFGQASNIHFDAMDRFASAVGVKLSSNAEKQIKKLIPTTIKGSKILPEMPASEIKEKGLHTEVYEVVYNDIVKQLNNKPKVDDLLNGIMQFISYNDPTLVIVDIGAGDRTYFVKKIQTALKKQLKGKTLKAEAKKTPAGNYNMSISVDGGELVTLSSRPIQNTFRNFVNSGEALRKWIAEI